MSPSSATSRHLRVLGPENETLTREGTTPRLHSRVKINESVFIQSLQMKDFKRLRLKNISKGGMYIESNESEVELGDAVLFVLVPKNKSTALGKGLSITGIAQIRWITKGGFGLEITHLLSEENAANFKKWITGLGPTESSG